MKNFYELVKDGAMVSKDDRFVPLRDVYEPFCDDCYSDNELELEYQGSPLVLKGLEQYGGEGMGEKFYYVFSVTYQGVTTNYKIDGYYASYAGHEWSSYRPYEVKHVPVTRMEWVKKES
jgi:hypothetical protein